MTSPQFLQQLHGLDWSSSRFHDMLSSILYGEEYKRCVGDLQNDSLVWLVDYLDKVRCCVTPSPRLYFKLSQRRLSIFSTLPVLLPGNVYANLEVYVATG